MRTPIRNRSLVYQLMISGLLIAISFHLASAGRSCRADEPQLVSELLFPLNAQHNHAPGIVVCPSGELFATWYRGAGERKADDVAVYAAWKAKGANAWSEPFVLADTPGFPDCNTALFLDRDQRLWLFYPTIIANSWESCLTNFKIAEHFKAPSAPKWEREAIIFLKPDDFAVAAEAALNEELAPYADKLDEKTQAGIAQLRQRLSDKLFSAWVGNRAASRLSCHRAAFSFRSIQILIRYPSWRSPMMVVKRGMRASRCLASAIFNPQSCVATTARWLPTCARMVRANAFV